MKYFLNDRTFGVLGLGMRSHEPSRDLHAEVNEHCKKLYKSEGTFAGIFLSVSYEATVQPIFSYPVIFMSLPTFIVAVAAAGAGWLAWHVARNFIVRSPLDNIPGPESVSYFKGNLSQLFNRNGWWFLDSLGTQYNSMVRLTGLFGHRMLYVFDPTALQQVIIKESEIYDMPEWSTDTVRMTLGPGLFGVHGATHRKQRKILNPAFSIKHMRALTPVFYAITHKLCTGIEKQIGDNVTTVNLLDWFGRTALELIGQGGLGYSMDTLEEPISNPFGNALKRILPTLFEFSDIQFLFKYIKKLGPARFRSFLADIVPIPKINRLRKLTLKLETESLKILAAKKAALYEDKPTGKPNEGKDIMSILLQANREATDGEGLSDQELLAQMTTLVVAGTDSTSNALCTMMDIFARNPDIQEKLRAEVVEAQERFGKDIPYDELVSLPYMDAFCRETLRIYPPVSLMMREAQKDIIMPLSRPVTGKDGIVMNEIPVPAGTTVVVGIRSCNLNTDIWGEDALEFKPERWMTQLPNTVTDSRIPGVYSNLMTFNGGGRSCIGFKFSQLEMKIVLSVIIPHFKVMLAENPDDIIWNLSNIRYPTIGKDSDIPAFTVKMERIKGY
ncbi:hypothetical protein QCA50_005220 [Cerrena zonata]|uniref:Cytochrome P450 n=1 Tax=Cerrena zonata TaxID=2478898 RepID=A0AAW0GIZ6_9APHY